MTFDEFYENCYLPHAFEIPVKKYTGGYESYTLTYANGDVYEQIYTLKPDAPKRYEGYWLSDFNSVSRWNGEVIEWPRRKKEDVA